MSFNTIKEHRVTTWVDAESVNPRHPYGLSLATEHRDAKCGADPFLPPSLRAANCLRARSEGDGAALRLCVSAMVAMKRDRRERGMLAAQSGTTRGGRASLAAFAARSYRMRLLRG